MMNPFSRLRNHQRRSCCLNTGSLYGALSGTAFVLAKTFKYSGGGGRQDLPYAILIVLVAGLAGGFLWQLGRALLGPPRK